MQDYSKNMKLLMPSTSMAIVQITILKFENFKILYIEILEFRFYLLNLYFDCIIGHSIRNTLMCPLSVWQY